MQSCSFINVFLFKKWGFSSSMERWVQAQWPLDGAIWHETVDCGGGSASANIQIIFMFWLIYSVFFSQSCCVIVAILLRVWKKSGQLRHSYLLQKYIIILHIKRRLFTFNYFTGCFFLSFFIRLRWRKKTVNAASFRPRDSHVTSGHVVQPLPPDLERSDSAVSCRRKLSSAHSKHAFRGQTPLRSVSDAAALLAGLLGMFAGPLRSCWGRQPVVPGPVQVTNTPPAENTLKKNTSNPANKERLIA